MSEDPKSSEVQTQRSRSSHSAWFGGAVLIIVGLAFMLWNFNIPYIQKSNWWALFILIPIVAILDDIYRIAISDAMGKAGRIASKVVGLFILSAVMVIFLFGINLGMYWPVLLIVAGLVFLVAALIK